MKNKIPGLSSIRMKLAGFVLLLVLAAILLMYILKLPMTEFIVGMAALVAAWFGGELFVRRQVHAMSQTAQKIADGDLSARTGLPDSADELGQLAKIFDRMAETLQQRIREREKLAAFAQFSPNPALEFAQDGELIYFNEAAWKLSQRAGMEHPRDILPPTAGAIVRDSLAAVESRHVETKINGRTFAWSFHPIAAGNVVHCYAEDTTERLNLEAQLRQSQKMESIGQLAAGVAHDFNNILTVIQGHSSALLSKENLPKEISEPLQAVYFAAERAAGLTRQLLMFSRKNTMQPRRLNLGEVVGNMNKMLPRLLGETIALQFQAPGKLPFVQGDSGMIEQIVLNLAVNARDAMPNGGTLSINLEAVTIDEAAAQKNSEASPGNFVRLDVIDTGCGMDAVTLAHIFEPFFTTKEIGKGTGLGLSTVYGIVKQHDGWIETTSKPGKGTAFSVFLPADESSAEPEKTKAENLHSVPGGEETVLVVEDEQVLREMARDILQDYGYKILEACNGKEAVSVWRKHTHEIDLLLTDLVMPEGISGVALAERLLDDRPELKIIFTSGYTAGEINPELLARSQAHFLQKPYTHAQLAKMVRCCLDQNVPVNAMA
jgi:signal transduction histidine kinase/HAMP domain-containing protein/ActR/RegA family two-component response regulator